jgi:hypothetical protein
MGMNLQFLFTIQIVADIVLCAVILFVLAKVSRDIRQRSSGMDARSVDEFKQLLDVSKADSVGLFEAMEESKKAFREICLALDEKEARLRKLIERSEAQFVKLQSKRQEIEETSPEKKYDEVIVMDGKGFSPGEISQSTGLTEGEVNLIIDLNRRRNENV